MRGLRWVPPLLLLMLSAACAIDDGGSPFVAPVTAELTALRGRLQVQGDTLLALLYDGRVVPLLGVSPASYAGFDGFEVVVEGAWEGTSFRPTALAVVDVTVTDPPIDTDEPRPQQEPQLRRP